MLIFKDKKLQISGNSKCFIIADEIIKHIDQLATYQIFFDEKNIVISPENSANENINLDININLNIIKPP